LNLRSSIKNIRVENGTIKNVLFICVENIRVEDITIENAADGYIT
jgi:hypothetical protein